MNNDDLAFASIEEIGRLFRSRKISPVELTKLMLARIERINPKINAYITVTPELAVARAKIAESELFGRRGKRRDRGPLHGIPISIKDNIYTCGIRTTGGSKILKDFIPFHDARVVSQLLEAGSVLLGKTNLHEFAYGVTTNNPHYGATRNPWDLRCIPGGSSGGSGAAVAAGLSYGSIGTDTGGSIRIPAGLCGIVGIKPGIGRVSVEGVIPLSPRLDVAGPMARTIQDAAILMEPIFLSVKRREPRLPALQKSLAKLRKLRLGVPREFPMDAIDEPVRAVFEAALHSFSKQGAQIKDISIPLLRETEHAGNQIAWAEAAHYHQQSGWYPGRSAEYGEDVRSRLEMGTKVTATAYLEALELRDKFIQAFHQAMADARVDALAVPTLPIGAPQIGEETTRIGGKDYPTRALLLRANRPANLAGIPAISIPCGLTPDGLPVGLQLIGAVTDEHLLVSIAHVYGRNNPATNWPRL